MIEQKPEKKGVRRTVAIALGIICIVLAVSLIEVIADLSLQISSLNSKVNNLNSIVNFSRQETWFGSKTLTLNPNQNFSDGFYAPLSGQLRVVGHTQPTLQGIWTNLTWAVLYGDESLYQVSPPPFIDSWSGNFFAEEFPIFSFSAFYPAVQNPNVEFVIGNRGTVPVTVNLTITFTY